MKKYLYDLEISAEKENEADRKAEMLKVLAAKLSADDLTAIANSNLPAVVILVSGLRHNEQEKLAHVLKYEPLKTAMAKKALGL